MILVNDIFKNKVSALGISLAGALGNNLAQLAAARFFLFGENTRFIAPILLISGFITGLLLGIFTEIFKQKSKWLYLVSSK